jgi:hypothetical protein
MTVNTSSLTSQTSEASRTGQTWQLELRPPLKEETPQEVAATIR